MGSPTFARRLSSDSSCPLSSELIHLYCDLLSFFSSLSDLTPSLAAISFAILSASLFSSKSALCFCFVESDSQNTAEPRSNSSLSFIMNCQPLRLVHSGSLHGLFGSSNASTQGVQLCRQLITSGPRLYRITRPCTRAWSTD